MQEKLENKTFFYCAITFFDVSLFDFNVTIPVWSGMFVVESQGMHHFMEDAPDVAQTMTLNGFHLQFLYFLF